jgi:hypothetical protein
MKVYWHRNPSFRAQQGQWARMQTVEAREKANATRRLKAYGGHDPRSRTGIGKACLMCGGEIKARFKEVNWAREHRRFCSRRCINQWRVRHRDNMSYSAPMRKVAFLPQNRAKRSAGLRNSPKVQRIVAMLHTEPFVKKAQATRNMMPGFQPVPEHYSAKWWNVRDPRGVAHKFRNLCYFIRQHPELFLPEDLLTPGKTSQCRAYGGICSIRPSPRRRITNGSWKGWTWVSHYEEIKMNGDDPLRREE